MHKIALIAIVTSVIVSGAACSDRTAHAHAHAAMAAAEAARAEIARVESEALVDSIRYDVLENDVEAFKAASKAWDSATEHAAEAARAAEAALEAARSSDVDAARSFAETATNERTKAQAARAETADHIVRIGVALPAQ